MNLERLQQFIEVKQQGTLSRAAEVLLISQPALTRNMQKLDEELNVPLFVRSKNRLELTATGEYVALQAEQLLKEVEVFKTDVQCYNDRQTTLTGGTCAPGPIFELEQRIGKERFKQQIKLEQQQAERLYEGLLDRTYDFIITDHPINERDIISKPFIKETLYLSLPPDHPLKDKSAIQLADFDGLTMLVRADLGIWNQFINQLHQTTLIQQDNNETFNQLAAASELPVFTTNISQEYGISHFQRIHIPIQAPFATVTFYLNVLKEKQGQLKDIMNEEIII